MLTLVREGEAAIDPTLPSHSPRRYAANDYKCLGPAAWKVCGQLEPSNPSQTLQQIGPARVTRLLNPTDAGLDTVWNGGHEHLDSELDTWGE
jgi:hypothetical protein